MADTLCVGIDFGAKRSFLAAWNGHEVEILACEPDENHKYLPTFVNFSNDEGVEVGTPAERNSSKKFTISLIKQLIGQKFSNAKEITGLPGDHPPPSVANGQACFKLPDGRTVTPTEVLIEILRYLRTILVERFGSVRYMNLVITIPAEASQEYRSDIKNAARAADFNDVSLITEPGATALAYKNQIEADEGKYFVVIDVGAAGTEISISTFRHSGLTVLKNSSNSIGGAQFDETVIQHVLTKLKVSGGDVAFKSLVRQAWLTAMASWKKEKDSININVEGRPSVPLTREQFKSLNHSNLKEILSAIKTLMVKEGNAISFDVGDIHWVALVGGYSQIPGLVEAVEGYFKMKIIDNSDMPFTFDEVTVYGATLEALRLFGDGEQDLPEMVDIASRKIGLQTFGGRMTPFIEEDTPIPTGPIPKLVSTSRDGQTSVIIKIYEGKEPLARQNKLLGTFNLTKIPPKPRGVAKIRVTYELDRDGILTVKAEDITHGFRNQIRIAKG